MTTANLNNYFEQGRILILRGRGVVGDMSIWLIRLLGKETTARDFWVGRIVFSSERHKHIIQYNGAEEAINSLGSSEILFIEKICNSLNKLEAEGNYINNEVLEI